MKKFKLTESVIMLIGANLIPVIGVVWWGWNTTDIVMLYWAENGIIGIFNILKMLTVKM